MEPAGSATSTQVPLVFAAAGGAACGTGAALLVLDAASLHS